jgi:hypothetical protein
VHYNALPAFGDLGEKVFFLVYRSPESGFIHLSTYLTVLKIDHPLNNVVFGFLVFHLGSLYFLLPFWFLLFGLLKLIQFCIIVESTRVQFLAESLKFKNSGQI